MRYERPKIVAHPQSTEQSIKAKVVMNCTVTGTPKPKITWLKNGIAIPDENLETYVIPELQLEHRGFYQCLAENSIPVDDDMNIKQNSSVASKEVLLNVKGMCMYRFEHAPGSI